MSTIRSVIAGVFVAIVVRSVIGLGIELSVAAGLVTFAASILWLRRYHEQAWAQAERQLTVLFPKPAPE